MALHSNISFIGVPALGVTLEERNPVPSSCIEDLGVVSDRGDTHISILVICHPTPDDNNNTLLLMPRAHQP